MFQMRLKGSHLSQIGAHFGISRVRVGQIITKVLAERRTAIHGQVDEVRTMQLERIELIVSDLIRYCVTRKEMRPVIDKDGQPVLNSDGTQKLEPLILPPDLDSIDRFIKLEARRAALLGLDAPTKLQPVAPGPLTFEGVIPVIDEQTKADLMASIMASV
jgi:hypothetical protein